jgi:hypothetical protein
MAYYESWFPGDDTDDVSVQASSLQIEMPANMQLRYKEINGVASVEKSQNGANTVYKWKVSNLPIKAHEPYAPAWSERGWVFGQLLLLLKWMDTKVIFLLGKKLESLIICSIKEEKRYLLE